MRMTSLRLGKRGEGGGEGEGEVDGPVDDDGTFLDDAAGAYDDGAGDGEDGRLWVDDRACVRVRRGRGPGESRRRRTGADGDVALELYILADDGL